MRNEMFSDDSTEVKSFTGIDTRPKEIVADAMDRGAIVLL
jgi:hypothetical protein